MKTIVLILLLISPAFLISQKEGYLQYTISANALDTSLEVRQKVGLMRNSSLKIFFAEMLARIEFKMAGGYNITTILDKTSNKSLNLMDSPMGKFAKRSNAEDLQTVPVVIDSSSQIEVFKEEERIILGYTCYRVLLKNKGFKIEYWCTNDINIDMSDYKLTNDFIPGFPMEFSAISEGVQLRYRASNILFSLENKETLFSLEVPVGYTVVASDE
ncbi:MAG: hypothetical protein VX280_04180 [Bacteroidota bacterium]|nr:hypothetical protein [Bacteroidota bacterium]